MAQVVGEPGHERHLGPDYHEVDAERRREREQAVCIVRQHRMAASELGDPGVARRRVQPFELGALRELPRERVLTASFEPTTSTLTGRAYSGGRQSSPSPAASGRRPSRSASVAARRLRTAARKMRSICATCELDASASFSYPASVSTAYDARIAVARSFLDVAGPLEPVQETVTPDGVSSRLPASSTLQPSIVGAREAQQGLVVVDRQPVFPHEIGAQHARGSRVALKQPDKRLHRHRRKLLAQYLTSHVSSCTFVCARKYIGRRSR